MRPEELPAVLAQAQIFSGLTDETLGAVAERAIKRVYSKGDPIFHQGDPGDALYVVAEGLVKVFIISEDGDEMVLATLRPPETFGELAVIDKGPRSASARAIERSTLVAFTRDAFFDLLQTHPQLSQAMFEQLGGLLRRALDQAADLIFLDLQGRVAKLLLSLADDVGTEESDGVLLDLNMTQGTLAGMVGGSRPSVNQILKGFEFRGYLELRGKQILIKQADKLRRRAQA